MTTSEKFQNIAGDYWLHPNGDIFFSEKVHGDVTWRRQGSIFEPIGLELFKKIIREDYQGEIRRGFKNLLGL